MGGDYYDRDYVPGASGISAKTNKNELDPKNYTSGNIIISHTTQPIVIAFDVTGSMGDWTKIFYEKLPVFYGQILMNKYLQEPSISISAIGDIESDQHPLQVTSFLQGKQIDSIILKLFLEGGGGANQKESYDIAAYFYNNFCNIKSARLPFFFFTGDQGYYQAPRSLKYYKYLNYRPSGQKVDTKAEWNNLLKSFNVFHLRKKYQQADIQQKIQHQWIQTLGKQRVINVSDPKAVVDIMLGIISMTKGVRTLQTYIDDMNQRGQSQQRIFIVRNALSQYSNALLNNTIQIVQNKTQLHKLKQLFGYKDKDVNSKQRESLNKMKQLFKGELPESFYCPITGEIFLNPVMTCDGQTYQKCAIDEWFKIHHTSPLTGAVLNNKNTTPNYLIKKMINQFVEKSK